MKVYMLYKRKKYKRKKILVVFFLFIISIFIQRKTDKNINLNIYNYINIAVNIDNNYIYQCITFLTSLLNNRAISTFYIIHILTENNLRNDTYNKVNSIIEKFGKNFSNVSYYNMGDQFRGATSGEIISKTSYYRISLPSLLPNVDKCIYMDTDVINFKDLSEMYNIQLNDSEYFCGILDYPGMINDVKKFKPNAEKYMNAGILLMNLKAMRNNYIETELRKFISSHFLNHHDQTAINAICYNNFKILPIKFSLFASIQSIEKLLSYNNRQNEKYRYNESELIQAYYHPISLHYAGFKKPWKKDYNRTNIAYWWYYAKKSGYYEEILEHYGFKKEKVDNILDKMTNYRKLRGI